ncbi:MAG: hypothetical protein JOZ05_05930, partial [Acetobacteraceae bacterium]|nr:hypothetical protein [Acetobacteraceae bacterium]
IAVDSLNGDVFIPMEGTTTTAANNLCALGCIAVYAPVPEPPTLPLVAAGVLGMVGVIGWRLRRS